MYGLWDRPHEVTKSDWIYADASVHRVISDVAVFVGSRQRHQILVAGDLNILYGYGEAGNSYWAGRYKTVFDRMLALGLPFVGPQTPNGRPSDPWPAELPRDSRNVPTYHTNRATPATAARQLDFVFASHAIAPSVTVRAFNNADAWGPSDHCRIGIELARRAV